MKRLNLCLVVVVFFMFIAKAWAFDEILLKNALILNGRAAEKALEKSLISSLWETPVEGEELIVNDSVKLKWNAMECDENGWFKGKDIRRALLCFHVDIKEKGIYLLHGMAHSRVYVNGVLRNGNPYQYKEDYEAWEAKFDYGMVPVELNEGVNELIFVCNRRMFKGVIKKSGKTAFFNLKDLTLPDFRKKENMEGVGAVPVINNSGDDLVNFKLIFSMDGKKTEKKLPLLHRNSVAKIPFEIIGKKSSKPGKKTGNLQLIDDDGKVLEQREIEIAIKDDHEVYRRTFISSVDKSVQYYAVRPPVGPVIKPLALFLSLHGASVEAVNQAGSYYGKNWGVVVCPTNRRPYGFNWEDIGRLDALEVLDLAEKEFDMDHERIYLTGHSMGGHGTWHLGVTCPGKFAAIAPSAGWVSFWSYTSRTGIEEDERDEIEKMLGRGALQSHTERFARNLSGTGVYILHGEDDKVVSVEEALLMEDSLETFHRDFDIHREPGAGHWWDHDEEAMGTDCVDWPDMFDYFARHSLAGKKRVRDVDFHTANPAISSERDWLEIISQEKQLMASHVKFRLFPGIRYFKGETENVKSMSFDLSVLPGDDEVFILADSQKVEISPKKDKVFLMKKDGEWGLVDGLDYDGKGPWRYGCFKEVFKNGVVLVYGTAGTEAENQWAFHKARYDAEHLWYQGNGSGLFLPDTLYDSQEYKGRNVLLYGNSETNRAWDKVLENCPVIVKRNHIKLGDKEFEGPGYSCVFIRPLPGSRRGCVGVVGGSGVPGFKMTNTAPYLRPGVGFPDCVIFDEKSLDDDTAGIKAAGFFGLDWTVEQGDFIWNE